MKIALIQLNAQHDKEKNIDRALRLTLKAIWQRAEFILLPEVFNYRGAAHPKMGYSKIAEAIPSHSSLPFMLLARTHKVHILLGSLYEKIKGTKKVYNTSILINPQGKIEAKYRKIHLFNAHLGKKTINESKNFLAGKKQVITNIKGFKVGFSICYDVRFPGLYQQYQKIGVDMITIPSSFTKTTGRAHWEILVRARAIENLCYVLAPNQYGKATNGVETYGNSLIVDPWGKILAKGSAEKEEIIYTTIDRKSLMDARKNLPGMSKGN